jgi:hypothetical protein
VNGDNSVPLAVSRVVYIQDTTAGSPVHTKTSFFAHDYEFPDSSAAAFDVYVSHGAGVVLATFSSILRLPSNGCIDVELLSVETAPSLPLRVPRVGLGNRPPVHCTVDDLLETGTVTWKSTKGSRTTRTTPSPGTYTLQVN